MAKPISSFQVRLRELMDREGMKQIDVVNRANEVGKKYGVSFSRPLVSQYLSGKSDAKSSNIIVLSEIFNVNEAWLLGFDVPMEKDNVSTKSPTESIPSNLTKVSVVNVPILGTIACGEPILAEENIEDYYPMVAELLPKGNTFLLRAYGDSMYPKIEEGDLVLP